MQITVFGANGRVGQLVVAEAIQRGYTVKAFVHGKESFSKHTNLKTVQGDIYSKADIENALVGSKVVISTLGSWGTPKKDILTTGMTHIIPAMERLGIQRLVSLTGAGCIFSQDVNSFKRILNRLPLLLVAPKVLRDGDHHLKLLESSSVDWTVLRSPVMNDLGQKSFKLGKMCPMPWSTINRTSVALAIIDSIEDTEFIKAAPFLVRSKH